VRKPFLRRRPGYSGRWYVRHNGKYVNLGPDKAEAFREYHRLMAEVAPEPLNPKATVAEVVGLYLDWVERNKAAATFAWYSHYLKSFSAFVGDLKLGALKPFHVTRWRETHGWEGNTGNASVRTVTACFNWAAKGGYLAANPVAGVEKPAPVAREWCLEPGQWEKLLAASDGPFRDLLLFMRLTGCRPQEARAIESRHVVGESIVFPRAESKGKRRQRVIPLNDQALAIVRRLALKSPDGPIFRNDDGAAWTKDALVCRFSRLSRKLGFTVTAYGLRHFFITEAIKAGLDPITLSRIVGHADLKMIQQRYAHVELCGDHMRAAAERAVADVA